MEWLNMVVMKDLVFLMPKKLKRFFVRMRVVGQLLPNVEVLLKTELFKKKNFLAQTCSALPPLINGHRKLRFGDGIGYGSIYSFECALGYQREGAPTILCQSDGLWSSLQPNCKSSI